MLRHGIWNSYQLDSVDVVALEPLPDADLRVCIAAAEADDVAGGVCEGGDLAVVRQDGVGARARQQVPHADHAVLFQVVNCVLEEVCESPPRWLALTVEHRRKGAGNRIQNFV